MTNDNAANSSPAGDAPGPHLSAGTLSAYIDGDLPKNARSAADAHLHACAACRSDLADLRATVAVLHSLPERRPQRSFQLSPDQANRRTSWFSTLFSGSPAVRIAAAAIAVLLIAVIAGDMLTHEGDHTQVQMAVQAPTTMNSAARSDAEESDSVQPRLGAKPASTNPPAAIDEAREAQPPNENGSAAQAPAGGAAAPAPAVARVAESSPAASPTAAIVATPSPTVAPTQTVQVTNIAGAQSDGTSHPSWWRVAEIALALVLLWLIVSTIGLRRIRP